MGSWCDLGSTLGSLKLSSVLNSPHTHIPHTLIHFTHTLTPTPHRHHTLTLTHHTHIYTLSHTPHSHTYTHTTLNTYIHTNSHIPHTHTHTPHTASQPHTHIYTHIRTHQTHTDTSLPSHTLPLIFLYSYNRGLQASGASVRTAFICLSVVLPDVMPL